MSHLCIHYVETEAVEILEMKAIVILIHIVKMQKTNEIISSYWRLEGTNELKPTTYNASNVMYIYLVWYIL